MSDRPFALTALTTKTDERCRPRNRESAAIHGRIMQFNRFDDRIATVMAISILETGCVHASRHPSHEAQISGETRFLIWERAESWNRLLL